ncbi:MAG: hypothetical protein J7K51_06155, partial [Thermotogae bacterium]|nr:hypothetical protein [Thermotogota bacterium]
NASLKSKPQRDTLSLWINCQWSCADQFHFILYIPITVGTGVYLLSDSPRANNIMELRSIGQV